MNTKKHVRAVSGPITMITPDLTSKGITLLVAFDHVESEFWRSRLLAIEARGALYREQNVQVLGISTADPHSMTKLSKELNLSFPLISDPDGRFLRSLDLFDDATDTASRALAILRDGNLVRFEHVVSTEIRRRFAPWVEEPVG